MLQVLKNRTYRRLFAAQAIALLGTGLATVALGLLAYDLAGADAGLVLGTALFIKMTAYVVVAPIAGAFADVLPRRWFLVCLDLVRVGVALLLPFVDQVWQIYLLIFLLQASSAAFTPTFQATIPDVLPDEDDYTNALSLSRLAYDLENLLSPALAAVLLTLMNFHWLFAGTAVGFVLSALLVLSAAIPFVGAAARRGGIYDKTTRGIRIYLATPRLRGLLGLSLAVAAAGAVVIVNTVVYVQHTLGRGETDVALALAAFGGGSMIVALGLPGLLKRWPERRLMMSGGMGLVFGLALMAAASLLAFSGWYLLLGVWFLLGAANAAVLTPSGRLLRRSAHAPTRPALFAAQFALSHACWLLTYPLAGWLGAEFGMTAAFLGLCLVGIVGLLAALLCWPAADPELVSHTHENLPDDHVHWSQGAMLSPRRHTHPYVIDDLHEDWPEP